MAARSGVPGIASPGLFVPGEPTASEAATNAQSTASVTAVYTSVPSVSD